MQNRYEENEHIGQYLDSSAKRRSNSNIIKQIQDPDLDKTCYLAASQYI